jgi:nitrogenase iron protein NifH
MALYAANNIATAVNNFADRGYAKVKGLILNHRNVEHEYEKVDAFAKDHDLSIIGDIPRSNEILHYEELGMTAIEGDPEGEIAQLFKNLAKDLLNDEAA